MLAKRTIPGSKSKRDFGQSRKWAKMLRAGVYARVSTLDQQTLPMQMRALRECAAKRGWTVVEEYKEVGSGAAARAMHQQLIDSARRRDIDVVLVWRLDRWGRSVADLVSTLQELTALGVGFISMPNGVTPPSTRSAMVAATAPGVASHTSAQSLGKSLSALSRFLQASSWLIDSAFGTSYFYAIKRPFIAADLHAPKPRLLPDEFEAELELARVVGLSSDAAEIGTGRDACVGAAEAHSVEGVEGFCPELKL